MLILALDTSTEKGSLALWAEARLLAEISLDAPGTYLQHLLPKVEELLQAAGRRLEEVGAIAVSQGPGNFTGLRISLATAKGLAWGLACPLVPVSTLEVLAAQFPFQPHPIAVLMDAKRQELYLGRYHCPEAEPQPLSDPVRLPLDELPGRLTPPLLLTGPGLTAYESYLKDHLPSGLLWAPPEMRYPRAATLARLGQSRWQQGLIAAPASLVPHYLRPAL